jgi:cell division protein FtsB
MPRSRTTTLVLVLATLAAVGYVMFVPARDYFDQQAATRDTQEQLDRLDTELADLDERQQRLQDPDYIAQLARERYNMARPDEQVYAVLPPPPPPLPIPTGWPFDSLRGAAAAATAPVG